nr:RNA-directed DNA polymerase, eukaryota, nucleotide-binding alpha-beta plait domain protein [Tanacetum cinerariifolium]
MSSGIEEFPFTYLGLPIEENMKQVNAWGHVVEKFKVRYKWRWKLGEDDEVTVKKLAILIEEKVLRVEGGSHETIWNNLVPKKVNIIVWRGLSGRLLFRVELDRRDIYLDLVLCPGRRRGLMHSLFTNYSRILGTLTSPPLYLMYGMGLFELLEVPEFIAQKDDHKSKRYKSCDDSSFNTRDSREGSFNLNNTAVDEEDEVQEVRPSRPMGRDQEKGKRRCPKNHFEQKDQFEKVYRFTNIGDNADDVSKVGKSVFVTNFPESVSARDLWKSCSVYVTVVDVFIPSKKSKAGKRFAFVRFIKVFNLDRLVENLCTIWTSRYHLYANSVRFERSHKSFLAPTANAAEVPKKSFVPQYSNARPGSYANVVNVIQDASPDFVSDERIVWMNIEGIPLRAWSRETFKKIRKKLAETLDLEDNEECSWFEQKNCSRGPNNHINEEVFGDVYGSDDDGVPETVFGSNTSSPNLVDEGKENSKSEDPFGIYDMLSNKKDN